MDNVNTKNTEMAKKVGRPPGRTKDRPVNMRMDDDFVASVDDWRKKQPGELMNRTDAIRRLVELGLSVPSGKGGKTK